MDYEILLRFLLAAIWGGLVGAEREYHNKSAGFRTLMMISIGSCFFTIMSQSIGSGNNPDRIASNIVTGIGFLGAGVIFREQGRVNGITTAAAIWAVAAVGMGIGAGYYFAAGCGSIMILAVLAVLRVLEKRIESHHLLRIYTIQGIYSAAQQNNITALLKEARLNFKLTKEIREGDEYTTTWQVKGKAGAHDIFTRQLMEDKTLKRIEY